MKSDVGPSTENCEPGGGDLPDADASSSAAIAREGVGVEGPGEPGGGGSHIGSNPHNGAAGAAGAREVGAVMADLADLGDEASMRERAHRICAEYLHGTWGRISPDELTIKKVSGGLSNLLYYCALPQTEDEHTLSSNTGGGSGGGSGGAGNATSEPRRVLLRLYGQLHGERALETLITESVICTLLSESQRGPRLFGVFPGGRLEEYIQARPLVTAELADPQLSVLIAEKVAQIHHMDVPISKEPRWLWDTMDRWLTSLEETMALKEAPEKLVPMLTRIRSLELRKELSWLRKFLMSVGSPVVFCHNDLQEGNILLRSEPATPTINSSQQCDALTSDRLIIIDFEYCSYNYRGFDFANHMCEWMYDYSNEQPPYFYKRPDSYPNERQQELFVRSYLRAYYDNGPPTVQSETHHFSGIADIEDEVTQVLAEIKAFTLASHLFWALWSAVYSSVSTITFDYWGYGESRLEAYFRHKEKILQDGISGNDSDTQRTDPPLG